MGLQARSVNAGEREEAQRLTRKYQQELRDLKKDFKKAQLAFTSSRNRDVLMAGATELHVTSLDQRERLVRATDKYADNKQRIRDMRSTVESTIEVGGNILEELDDQRSRMERMIDKLRGINSKVDQARGIMGRMGRRLIANKLVVIGIILVLVLLILAIIYLRFFWGTGGGGGGGKREAPHDDYNADDGHEHSGSGGGGGGNFSSSTSSIAQSAKSIEEGDSGRRGFWSWL
ncbi:hypothetical protein QOT17_006117 [Balamuthia mandrillaris]